MQSLRRAVPIMRMISKSKGSANLAGRATRRFVCVGVGAGAVGFALNLGVSHCEASTKIELLQKQEDEEEKQIVLHSASDGHVEINGRVYKLASIEARIWVTRHPRASTN